MDLTFVYFNDEGVRRDYHVRGRLCTIGRKPECDLQIPIPTVSREHCAVRIDGSRALARDIGSSNGSFRNGKRIEGEEELRAGDLLTIGTVQLTVRINGEPKHIEPPLLDAPTAAHSPATPSRPTLSAPKPVPATAKAPAKAPAPTAAPDDSGDDVADLLAKPGFGDDSSVFDVDLNNDGGR